MKRENRRIHSESGFTLLEIIVVILIVAVLAGLALPRFFRTVEYSRSMEAMTALGTIRQAIQRCYLYDGDYQQCNISSVAPVVNDLDIDNPGLAANTLFDYASIAPTTSTFIITATRNTTDGGDGISTITLDQDGNRAGGGVFSSIR